MRREEAMAILSEYTKGESLLNHALSVERVLRAYARSCGEDPETWGIAGLLHDADYEAFPDDHPRIIVERLRSMGEETLAHAISAHDTRWGVPYTTRLSKALLACDELTGFIGACARVRPDGLASLEPKSVIKKLKDRSFAAKVDRDEVAKGAEIFGVALEDHIRFIVAALRDSPAPAAAPPDSHPPQG